MNIDDYVWIEGDQKLIYWPRCVIKGCPNRRCDSLGSNYCWPHTGQDKDSAQIVWEPAVDDIKQEA